MRRKIKSLIHQIILSRGKNSIFDQSLETGWENHPVEYGSKCINSLIKRSENPKGLVILAHPYLSEARQFFLLRGHAQMYTKMDYHVVIFDFNGFGHSPFENFEFELDVYHVALHYHLMFPDLPCIGHGVSFGASHLITCSTLKGHVFNKIIIENCLDSNLSYYKKRNLKLHYLMRSMMAMSSSLNKNHDYVKSAANIHSVDAALMIYNSEDDLTTIDMGQKILGQCVLPARMEIFEGKHLEAFQKNPEKYTSTIKTFLEPSFG